MKQKICTLCLLFSVAFLAACSSDPASPDGDRTALLTAHTWKTTKVSLGGLDVTETSAQETTYNADGTYSAKYSDGSTEDGTWEFREDETKLYQDEGAGESATWDILELTSSSLKLKADLDLGGTPVPAEYKGVPK